MASSPLLGSMSRRNLMGMKNGVSHEYSDPFWFLSSSFSLFCEERDPFSFYCLVKKTSTCPESDKRHRMAAMLQRKSDIQTVLILLPLKM